MDGDPDGDRQTPRHCRIDDNGHTWRACPGCRRSAEAGADAAGKCLGILPHLRENAARYFSKGDFRSDRWSTPGHPAQNAGWRELVAQSQTYWLPSWVRLGRRRRARQDLTKRDADSTGSRPKTIWSRVHRGAANRWPAYCLTLLYENRPLRATPAVISGD